MQQSQTSSAIGIWPPRRWTVVYFDFILACVHRDEWKCWNLQQLFNTITKQVAVFLCVWIRFENLSDWRSRKNVLQCSDSLLTFSPPTRKRSTAAMLTLMLWQRSWRTSRMSEPERRVMEEQEPSGSITLHWRGDRSHGPTEWRLSPWMYREFMFSWCYGNFSTFILKNEWAWVGDGPVCVAMEIRPVESYLSLAGSGHLKTGTWRQGALGLSPSIAAPVICKEPAQRKTVIDAQLFPHPQVEVWDHFSSIITTKCQHSHGFTHKLVSELTWLLISHPGWYLQCPSSSDPSQSSCCATKRRRFLVSCQHSLHGCLHWGTFPTSAFWPPVG